MKKLFSLFFLLLFGFTSQAQLPGKLDSLIKVYEALKEDTAKVDRFLWIANETSSIDTALSGQYGRRAYTLAIKLNDNKGVGNSYNYFGKVHYLRQNLDDALACFKKADEYFRKCGFLKGSASVLNNCGVIYNSKGDYEMALVFQKKALEANIKSKNEEGIGNNYINIGNTLNQKGDFAAAMDWFIKAEKIFSKLKKWESLATAYYNMGYVYYNLREVKKSLEYCQKALTLREEKSFNKVGMAYCHVFFAAVYSDSLTLDIEKANYHNHKVIELCAETGDRLTLTTSYINLVKSYLALHQEDSALVNAQKAYEISKQMGDNKFIASSLLYMGEVYRKMKKHEQAIKYYKEAYEISQKMGDDITESNSAQSMSVCYYNLSKYKDAYNYLLMYTRKKDIMFSHEILKSTTEMEAKYQGEKKQLEIDNLNKTKKVQELELATKQKESAAKNKILLLGAIALIGIAVFAFFAFTNFKRAKKANLIINSQKAMVELQKEEITSQKVLVEEKQKEIIDSINYAQKIQSAVLTSEEVWKKISPEHFIIFLPKDIVSGDFYWAYNTLNNRSVFALADCTGHGVPGGFMSMLGNSFLNELVVENKLFKADVILNKLREKIIKALGQKGAEDRKDGMDMALCVWNKLDNTLEFSGANNSLWLIRNNELTQYQGDKMPIGQFSEELKPFSSHTVPLQKNDLIVLCTDGFADQFGGGSGKKLKSKNLKEFLIKNSGNSLQQQKTDLTDLFSKWKGNHQQVDDVSLIMLKVV
jgi:serine phosphatase RsbU (regulator of sigma subunit)/tetratricopeptide (TPR) repeat protein